MSTQRRAALRVPPFFRRLFKFTSMDFETAVWEMINLIIAPKKVFRNIYYHKRLYGPANLWKTKNSYHRPDPAFTYILSLFMFLTGLAWGIAYANGVGPTIQVAFVFVLGHFLASALLVSTVMFFLVGRVFGKRRQGLFGPDPGGEETLEFGYCFDVSIRAFLPIWLFLYILQFLLLPLIAPDYWVSNFFGNTMYLLAWCYYLVITFLGYNALPFLSHTNIILAPIPLVCLLWILSLFTFDCATHFAPVMWCGVHLRKFV